jgi:mannosyltransferase
MARDDLGVAAGDDLEVIPDVDRPASRSPRWRPHDDPLVVGAGLAGLVLLSLLVRAEGIPVWYWIDEALSIGIASHPLHEIPGLLRMDGSPPLYYLLLHLWMRVFGSGEVATHSLSLLFAVAAVPVGWWAGRTLVDRRTGWFVAALAAGIPFLTDYARETRMYTLVVVLALVVTVSFVEAFVRGSRRHTPLFVGSLVALLYTHNWGLYVAAAAVVCLVPLTWLSRDQPEVRRRALVAMGAVGLAYLPWTVVLVSQLSATGAPWSLTPSIRQVVVDLNTVLNERVVGVLALVVAGGVLPVLRRPTSAHGLVGWVLVMFVAVPVAVGFLVAQVEPSWSYRYLAVVVGPLLLLFGWGMARTGAVGLAALAIVLLFWVQPLNRLESGFVTVAHEEKSDAKALADRLEATVGEGDLVVVTHPETVPLFATYLPEGLTFADPRGVVDDPSVMDWRHAMADLQASSVTRDLLPLVDSLPRGGRVVLVRPAEVLDLENDWIQLFQAKGDEWQRALDRHGDLETAARSLSPRTGQESRFPYAASVYEKR